MKLFFAASMAAAALAVIDCKPVETKPVVSASRSVTAIMSASVSSAPQVVLEMPLRDSAKELKEAQIISPAPVIAPLPDDAEPTPNNPDSGPVVEEPVVESISKPSVDTTFFPQQPAPLLSDKELRNLESIRAVASQIGTCKAEANAKCEVVKKTDGIICSNSSAGIDCNIRKGIPCDDEAYNACIDFAQTSGVFCSIGGCAQVL